MFFFSVPIEGLALLCDRSSATMNSWLISSGNCNSCWPWTTVSQGLFIFINHVSIPIYIMCSWPRTTLCQGICIHRTELAWVCLCQMQGMFTNQPYILMIHGCQYAHITEKLISWRWIWVSGYPSMAFVRHKICAYLDIRLLFSKAVTAILHLW